MIGEKVYMHFDEQVVFDFLHRQPKIRGTLCIPMTFPEIANGVGLTPVQVARSMEGLRDKGVIHITQSLDPYKIYMISLMEG